MAQIAEAAQIQLSELEMVQSMYSGPGEVVIENSGGVVERQACVEGGETTPAPVVTRLDYHINLNSHQCSSCLCVSLPPLYPFTRAECVLRSDALGKHILLEWNNNLKQEMEDQPEGEPVVGVLLAWLTELMNHHDTQEPTDSSSDSTAASSSNSSNSKKTTFCRMWLYSHHIYSKVKRSDLLSLAPEYCLTGFTLPGKPGLVCAEGTQQNTQQWWSLVRGWQWQRIVCTRQESSALGPEEDVDTHRRFTGFRELGSADGIRVKGGGFHVDMGDLYRFLKQHKSDYMFKEYFGVEGREAAE